MGGACSTNGGEEECTIVRVLQERTEFSFQRITVYKHEDYIRFEVFTAVVMKRFLLNVIFGRFVKICRRFLVLAKIRQEYLAFYMKTSLPFAAISSLTC
jgi:hypothetical protein